MHRGEQLLLLAMPQVVFLELAPRGASPPFATRADVVDGVIGVASSASCLIVHTLYCSKSGSLLARAA